MDGAPSGLQITLRTSFLVAFLCVLCSQGGSAHSTPPQGDPLQLPLLCTRLWGLGETGMEEASPVWGNVLLRDLDIHPSRPQFLTSGTRVQASLQYPPLGCRSLQDALDIGSSVFSLQLYCRTFLQATCPDWASVSLPIEPEDL